MLKFTNRWHSHDQWCSKENLKSWEHAINIFILHNGRYILYTGHVSVILLRINQAKAEKSSKNLQSFIDVFNCTPRIIMQLFFNVRCYISPWVVCNFLAVNFIGWLVRYERCCFVNRRIAGRNRIKENIRNTMFSFQLCYQDNVYAYPVRAKFVIIFTLRIITSYTESLDWKCCSYLWSFELIMNLGKFQWILLCQFLVFESANVEITYCRK